MKTLTKKYKIHENFASNGQMDKNKNITVKCLISRTLTQSDLATLNTHLKNNNLTLAPVRSDSVSISGSVDSLSKMFNTTVHEFKSKSDQKSYFAHVSDVNIPNELDFVTDVLGLNTTPFMKPHFKLKNNAAKAALSSFTPLQLASIYKFPSSYNGSGQTIAIIELGGGYFMSDLTTYFKKLGLTTIPKIVSVSVDGGFNYPNDPSGASFEVVLDIEVAGAIANASTIVVYFAPNSTQGFYDAIYKAINDKQYKPSIISISWGAAEVYWSTSTMNAYNNLFATAVSKGINIFVAAGDSGSNDGVGDSLPHVDFPASSPNAIGCGGTTLTSNGATITSETVWNNGPDSATGGGFSSLFTKPNYQNGISAIQNYRGVPDICANADPNTGYQIYLGGKYYTIGGTSAVAPLLAGLTARLNQQKGTSIGFLNTNLYTKKPCNDVTSGNNGTYSATTGWDPCTGLGSPNIQSTNSLFKTLKK